MRAEPNDAAGGLSPVRTIERTMRILKALGHGSDYLTLTEVSRSVDLHKSTVLRFLRTLEQGGFAASGPGGKGWRPGPVFLEIRARTVAAQDLAEIARADMEKTVKLTSETVQLAILPDSQIRYIAKVEPLDPPIRINTQVGTRRPIHCTALGKVLAAWRDRREVDAILAEAGLPRFTEATITTPEAYHRALAETRRRGFATDLGEFNRLVTCVAAPVRGPEGQVVAGLSISSLGLEAGSPRLAELVAHAQATADRISERLGWTATP